MSVTHVDVDLGSRAYPIAIECGALNHPPTFIQSLVDRQGLKTQQAIIVSDSNVAPLYLETVTTKLTDIFQTVESLIVPAGESAKSVKQLDTLWQAMLERQACRSTVLFALGGGVVGDLAGFAAASFGRGIPFVQIPTTLLAQVDSSVGGKVGINLPGAKNMVGAFWQPAGVLIDPDVLQTLSPRDFRCGLAEVVKYGAIMDADFFQFLETSVSKTLALDPQTLVAIIAKCCRLKTEIVIEDETETSGRRAILNYGHTFGHALENVAGYGQYSHGEAISIGMHCAAKLACRLGRIDQALVDRQSALLTSFSLPIELPDPQPAFVSKLVDAMQHDKKVESGELRLVLPDRLGAVSLVAAPSDDLLYDSFLRLQKK